jgi:hypothetical protein
MENKNELLLCECSSAEHQMILRTVGDDPEVYIDIHLVSYSFWKRFKHGMRYIFGYKCKYGAFDEIITTKDKLGEIVGKIINK